MHLHYTFEVTILARLADVLALMQELRGVARAVRWRQAPTGKGTES